MEIKAVDKLQAKAANQSPLTQWVAGAKEDCEDGEDVLDAESF